MLGAKESVKDASNRQCLVMEKAKMWLVSVFNRPDVNDKGSLWL